MVYEELKNAASAKAALAVLALFGVALLCAEFFSGIQNATDADCKADKAAESIASDLAGVLRIVKIAPARTALDKDICIIVAGVSSSAEKDRLNSELALASGLRDKTAQDFTEATERFKTAQAEATEQRDLVKTIEAKGPVAAAELKEATKVLGERENTVTKAATEATKLERSAGEAENKYTIAKAAVEAIPADIKLNLMINGVAASHITFFTKPEPGIQVFKTRLNGGASASSDEGKFWRRIFTGAIVPDANGTWGEKQLLFSVSRSNANSLDTQANPVTLVLFNKIPLLVGFSCFALLIFSFVLTARETAILRDGGIPTNSYSLSRTQLAFWFFIVTAGFLYIWIILGEYNGIITPGILALLGIGSTTAIASASITTGTKKKGNFWQNLVMDGNGIQLPRLQALAWTCILGAIFCWNVIVNFQMPDFDSNLLILMAVSQAAYTVMKTQETGIKTPENAA